MNKKLKTSIALAMTLVGVMTIALSSPSVYAACENEGAYGQTCIYNKTFELTKKVRIEGDSKWHDKVTDVKEGDVIEFRIEIENIGEVEVDDMKMSDNLPKELERIGGSGLTEYWNDFEVGDEKKFTIKARIKSSEFDRDGDFEKCVVNKAKVEYKDTLEGADTATVCYGEEEIKELPETGATYTEMLSVVGAASTGLGLLLKRKK